MNGKIYDSFWSLLHDIRQNWNFKMSLSHFDIERRNFNIRNENSFLKWNTIDTRKVCNILYYKNELNGIR